MSKKINKSDLLLYNHLQTLQSSSLLSTTTTNHPSLSSTASASSSSTHSLVLIEQINSKIFQMEQRMSSIETIVKYSNEKDNSNNSILTQLNDIRSQILSKCNTSDVENMLLSKVERSELDIRLHQKGEKNIIDERLRCIESVLAEHEMSLTTLSIGNKPIMSSTTSFDSNTTRSKKLPSYIPYRENDDPEERMKRLLSEGRSEAMKHITSTKMDQTATAVTEIDYYMREILEKRIKEVEHNVNKMKEWESVIQRNIHELNRISPIEVSIDAIYVQIQELKSQLGNSLNVPITSIILEIENKMREMDELIQSQMSLDEQERLYFRQGLNEIRQRTELLSGTIENTLEDFNHLSNEFRYHEQEMKKQFVNVESLQLQQQRLIQQIEQTPIPPPSPIPIFPPQPPLPQLEESQLQSQQQQQQQQQQLQEELNFTIISRIEELEHFCCFSSSKPSTKNIQNIIENIRSIKHFVNRLDERFHQFMVQQSNNHIQPPPPPPQQPQQPQQPQILIPTQPIQNNSQPLPQLQQLSLNQNLLEDHNRIKQLRSMVKNLIQRVESCEVVDQVHQVRLDSIEECVRSHYSKYEKRQEQRNSEKYFESKSSNNKKLQIDKNERIRGFSRLDSPPISPL